MLFLYFAVNLFTPRTNIGMGHYRTGGMLKGQKLATQLFPNHVLNNETTTGNVFECAHLCDKYLYCTTFSYNEATHECRFVVGMTSTSDPAALAVTSMLTIFMFSFFTLQADSGFDTYQIVA